VEVVFTIDNGGNGDLTLATPLAVTGTNASDFSIVSQPTSTVAAGGSTTFMVRFTPGAGGARTASLAIGNNDADENPYNVDLVGFGLLPEINLKQGSIDLADGDGHDFGDLSASDHADVVFTIENFGDGELLLSLPLTISGINADQFSVVSQPAAQVAAYGSTTFTARFAPTSAGTKTAAIAIGNNDSDENPFDLLLSGFATAVAGPEMNLAQGGNGLVDGDTFTFAATESGKTLDKTFSIENLGTAALTISVPVTVTGADASQFTIQSQPASSVAAGGSTSFTVRFSPTSAGAKIAALAIGNNDSDENPYNLVLTGTGLRSGGTSYTVDTLVVAGQGHFNPTQRLVAENGSVTFEVIADSGYVIVDVSGCGGIWTGSSPYATGPVTGDCTITASFKKKTTTVGFPWYMFLPGIMRNAKP